jgi:hypothetical protein
MNVRCLASLVVLFGLSLGVQAEQAEFEAGHFVETKCTACHDSSVYTRKNRRVKSLDRLQSQVRMCDANLGTKLFDEDLLSVVDYLNDNYYKFEK